VAKHVQRAIVVDEDGDVVMIEREMTGIVVENDDGAAIGVQTAVRGVVLGNVLNSEQRSRPAIEAAATPTITQPSRNANANANNENNYDDDDGCCSKCSCCCVIKWTLLTIFCLPCLPFICIYYCCCHE